MRFRIRSVATALLLLVLALSPVLGQGSVGLAQSIAQGPLTAWCELRDDFRDFRLDRMAEVAVLERIFTPKKGQCLEDHFKRVATSLAEYKELMTAACRGVQAGEALIATADTRTHRSIAQMQLDALVR